MKNIIETLGESLTEIIGAAAVFFGLAGVVTVFRIFGDELISYFM